LFGICYLQWCLLELSFINDCRKTTKRALNRISEAWVDYSYAPIRGRPGYERALKSFYEKIKNGEHEQYFFLDFSIILKKIDLNNRNRIVKKIR